MEKLNLKSNLKESFRLGANQERALGRLGVVTVKDLLYYFPVRYGAISQIKNIGEIRAGEEVTLFGQISNLKIRKSFRSRVPLSEAKLTDISGKKIKIIWFHQPFIARLVAEGDSVRVTGKVSENKSGYSVLNPEIERVESLPIEGANIFGEEDSAPVFGYPVYRETKGLSSKWIYHTIVKIIKTGVLDNTEDHIPKTLLKKYNLPNLKTALIWIHTPRKEADAESARKRFAFEEIFLIQIRNQLYREEYEKNFSYKVDIAEEESNKFIESFGFKPTKSQEKALAQIFKDIESGRPMMRLVEGDVGSGKTFIAAVISHAIVNNRPKSGGLAQEFGNLQVGYMAPTEVLAKQLFENFIKYFRNSPIQIALITGKECRKFPSKIAREPWAPISKAQLLKWVKNGEIPIVIGTHALIQKSVEFRDLALVIVDEQHRFGTNQRMLLAKKDKRVPHYLSMTATPIPRTLALTIYGDLDLTIIDELPKDRKKVITKIVLDSERNNAYEELRKELKYGRQAYVICPRIEEPDESKATALNTKAVKTEAKFLQEKIFPEYEIEILHSKMSKESKDKVMKKFEAGEIDILVSTSVIEVGINVPNATAIIIEGAERFGLAQLHQLRGRVQRSEKQSYCYLFTSKGSEKNTVRLEALEKSTSGFDLAEIDLTIRGGGDLAGQKQWGVSDLAMEALHNLKLVELAREEAKALVEKDPKLAKTPGLKAWLEQNDYLIHFE